MTAISTPPSLRVPGTLAVAVAEMQQRLVNYELAQSAFVVAANRYTEHDAVSSRMRIVAIDRLIKGGMGKTDAKESPRLDPEYAAHGDTLTQLGHEKALCEAELHIAKARLEVSIVTVRAFTFGYGEIGS